METLPMQALSMRCALLALLLLGSVAVQAADREKTDVIVLQNGDRITGEIVSLEYGILQLKTSNMGTLSIEWPAIDSITSTYGFFIERSGARLYYGHISMVDESTFQVRDGDTVVANMPMLDVMRLSQVEDGFWQRISGSLSLGYNFTKSSEVSTGSFTFNTEYRAPRLESSLNISLLTTDSPGGGSTDRDQISNSTRFMRANRNYWVALSSLERNEELGIDGRLQLGAALGRHFRQRSTFEITGLAGLSFNKEWTTGVDSEQESLEGVLGAEWRVFQFSDPETSIDSSLRVYPSITESGRWRSELNIVLSRELFADFTINLTYFNSYDSDPPDDNATSTDYGIVTGFGYKF